MLTLLPKIIKTAHFVYKYKLSEVPQGHDKMLGLR